MASWSYGSVKRELRHDLGLYRQSRMNGELLSRARRLAFRRKGKLRRAQDQKHANLLRSRAGEQKHANLAVEQKDRQIPLNRSPGARKKNETKRKLKLKLNYARREQGSPEQRIIGARPGPGKNAKREGSESVIVCDFPAEEGKVGEVGKL